MKYMGSKRRIAAELLAVMMQSYQDEHPAFVDVFCGGCNMLDKVPENWKRIANDNNHALIHMWATLTNFDFNFPQIITHEFYSDVRKAWREGDVNRYSLAMQGWVGFMASYNGRFYDGGYSGHSVGGRDYIKEQINNTLKQVPLLKNVVWCAGDYSELSPLPKHCLIYCDPPYKNTTQYTTSNGFDYDRFYEWCRKMTAVGHQVFISEYEMPEDFRCIWYKEVTNSMHQRHTYKPTERLFTL